MKSVMIALAALTLTAGAASAASGDRDHRRMETHRSAVHVQTRGWHAKQHKLYRWQKWHKHGHRHHQGGHRHGHR